MCAIDSRCHQVPNKPNGRVHTVADFTQDFVFLGIDIADIHWMKSAWFVRVSTLLNVAFSTGRRCEGAGGLRFRRRSLRACICKGGMILGSSDGGHDETLQAKMMIEEMGSGGRKCWRWWFKLLSSCWNWGERGEWAAGAYIKEVVVSHSARVEAIPNW